jgi:hypothetical protein
MSPVRILSELKVLSTFRSGLLGLFHNPASIYIPSGIARLRMPGCRLKRPSSKSRKVRIASVEMRGVAIGVTEDGG